MADDQSNTLADTADAAAQLAQLRAENATLRARLRRRANVRRWIATVLTVLSSLLVIVSAVAVWTDRTAFNTDRFMATVEPALDDPDFYTAVGNVVSERAVEALDLETRVANRLTQLDEYVSQALVDAVGVNPQQRQLLSRFERPSLAALAAPIAGALEDRVTEIIQRRVESGQFAARLAEVVRRAHEATVALVRDELDELPNVYVTGGDVRLNLIPIIADALHEVIDEVRDFLPDIELPDLVSNQVAQGRQQLSEALQAQLPDDFGQVTLMSEAALDDVQQTVHRLDQLVWLILLLTLAMITITIAVSPIRRRAVIQLGAGIVIGLIVGAVIIRRLQAAILGSIERADGERAAEILMGATMSSLRTVALVVGASALIAAIVAYLAGRPAWLGRLAGRVSRLISRAAGPSELDRRVGAHYEKLQIAGVVLAVAILFVTGVGIIQLVLLGLLLALYLWALSESKRHAS